MFFPTDKPPPSISENDVVKSLPTSSSTSTLVPEIDDTETIRKTATLKVNTTKNPNKDSESKKREDLTSLGSDDSGEILTILNPKNL